MQSYEVSNKKHICVCVCKYVSMSICIVQDVQLKDITYILINIFHVLPSYFLGTKPLATIQLSVNASDYDKR